ncbi:putative pentatricopeptide repeat-containing protein At5g06400, mitochondrial [Momordica charantia]|uniref:Pentatricopeptide repeat-containing protein At5g06400, mitochondrial n=1 Tax=Momordica charantia TaxID=3673 RepID=A0A6J1DEQ8_MOMCH|nr:putative pentatricopeptide repeat-containing protein At5g06400, mitochondrial [Momordica charantia]
MRRLIRFQSSNLNSTLNFLRFQLSELQILRFSTLVRKRRNSSRSGETQKIQSPETADTSSFRSLFNEITQILGSESYVHDKTSFRNLGLEKGGEGDSLKGEEQLHCAPDVCKNAEQETEGTQLVFSEENDVSATVHEVSSVIRAESGLVSMEERLGSLDVMFSSEVVEKVLKRSFKFPHLALGFFNWVKSRDGFQCTTSIFNTMLTISGEAKDFKLIEKLVEEMENNSLEKDIKTWTILISLYGNAKLTGKALMVYGKMKESGCEPDGVVYKTLICSLSAAGKPELAMEFYQEMAKKGIGVFDMKMCKVLLSSLAASGDTASVLEIAKDMVALFKVSEHDVYHYILKSFCISRRVKEALEFIHALNSKGMILDPEYFEILFAGLCRANRVEDALELVDIMKRKNVVDGKVYGIIINWYLRRNEVLKALDLFHNMKEIGYLPTTSTYTQLMQHLFRLAEYEKGFELYKEMLEKRIELDAVAIMTVVVGNVRQNLISEAWKVFRTMEDKPTWKSFSVFIRELFKVSRTDEIVKVLNEMQASNIAVPERLFHSVVSYMEKRGDIVSLEKVKRLRSIAEHFPQEVEVNRGDDAPKIKDLCLEVNFKHSEPSQPTSIACHVETLSRNYREEDLDEIYKILSSSTDGNQIKKALENSRVVFTPELVLEILRKCSIEGCAALHFFAWVGKQPGYNHTTETYNMAMKLAGIGKDFKHMRSLFYEMRRRGCIITPDTWTIVIMQYGRAGLTDIALKFFGEMKESNIKPNANTYKYLIITLCGSKRRKVNEAIALFQEMIRSEYIPDKELLEAYLGCLCKLGRLSEAKECIDYLRNIGFTTPLIYSMHIRALCRAGRLDDALTLLEEVGAAERSKLENYIYGSLIHGLLQRGRMEEALAKMNSMKQVGVNPTVHVYTSFIVYSFKENQTRRALEIVAKMMQEGCEPTIATYSAVIHGFMNMGKFGEGWKIFHYIKKNGPFPDFRAYSMLISCLCKEGRSEEALQIISEMLSSGIAPSSVNFRTVFFGLNREGKKNLTGDVLEQKLGLIRRRKFQR